MAAAAAPPCTPYSANIFGDGTRVCFKATAIPDHLGPPKTKGYEWYGLSADDYAFGVITGAASHRNWLVELEIDDSELIFASSQLSVVQQPDIVGPETTAFPEDHPVDYHSEEEDMETSTGRPETPERLNPQELDEPEKVKVGDVEWTYMPRHLLPPEYQIGPTMEDAPSPAVRGLAWDKDMDFQDVFMHFFLMTFEKMAEKINPVLAAQKQTPTSVDELSIWHALLIGASLYSQKGERLWDRPVVGSKRNFRDNGADFGEYMSLTRFTRLKKVILSPFTDTEDAAVNPWSKADAMVDAFNLCRARVMTVLSGFFTVDESMSAYRPRSTKHGNLPSLSHIPRKPEPLGTEFKNLACCVTGIMMKLELQKKADVMHTKEHYRSYGATVACTLRLSDGQGDEEDWTIFGDAWFGSLNTTKALMKRRVGKSGKTYFTGIVKTAHKNYPKEFLRKKLEDRGAGTHKVLVTKINGVEYLAIGYRYNRRKPIFIITDRGSLSKGKPYMQRWPDEFGNQRARQVSRFKLITEYFTVNNLIDSHNQTRQKLLALEKSWVTTDGFFRIYTTLVGMCVTDAFRAYRHFTAQKENKDVTLQWFQNCLVADLMKSHAALQKPKQREAKEHPLVKISQEKKQVQQNCVWCRDTAKLTRNVETARSRTMWKCGHPECHNVWLCKDKGTEGVEGFRNCHSMHILHGTPENMGNKQ